jgi:DNA mismatch endonuclease, patch repair protein
MPDVFTKAKRSAVMARIRSSGNKDTDLALMGVFRRHGVSGWRRHHPVFGRPDFVFIKIKLAVFVDGCFWHGCPRHSSFPATNRAFWKRKLTANRLRDRLVSRTLRRNAGRVVRIWEHELLSRHEKQVVGRMQRALL